MAKRKQKVEEIENTSIETTSIDNNIEEIINNDNKEIIENKTTKENKTEYIITKKTEGVYIRKLRRL